MSQIVDSISTRMESCEAISGEEFRSEIDDSKINIDGTGPRKHGLCVASSDVVSLYQSLDISQCAKICAEKLKRSPLKFENVDMTWATVYCALSMTQDIFYRERISHLIPRRASNKEPDHNH